MIKSFAALVFALALGGCVILGDRSGSETPDYQVTADLGRGVQVRSYAPRLVATATIDGDGDWSSRSTAFQLLFNYISGANTGQEKIAMTVPVQSARDGEKIDMTVPVESDSSGTAFRMRFFFPAQYTLETAPVPTDPRVTLEILPATELAVLEFSGFWNETILKDQKRKLAVVVERSDWHATGAPVEMFYDPPFSIPWLRRNEVAVPVIR
jgi:hypothetical protein